MGETWWCRNLGDPMLADAELARIGDEFRARFPAAPPEAAVFLRHESSGDLHCELLVYFSPAAKQLAVAVDAEPCAKPRSMGLGLLAGAELAWRWFDAV